jgi:hypothetical protein
MVVESLLLTAACLSIVCIMELNQNVKKERKKGHSLVLFCAITKIDVYRRNRVSSFLVSYVESQPAINSCVVLPAFIGSLLYVIP